MSFHERRRRAIALALRDLAAELSRPRGGSGRRTASAISPKELEDLADADPSSCRDKVGQLLVTLQKAESNLSDVERRIYWRLRDLASMPAPPAADAGLGGRALQTLQQLRGRVETITSSFVRTTAFARVDCGHEPFTLGIKDLLLVGAIAHADTLLIGRTGTGKSRLAALFMKALFGFEGYYTKTVLPSMGPADFLDVDFAAMSKGTLRGAMSATAALTRPGLVINEANRAPGMVQSVLIPLLDREFEAEGTSLPVGVEVPGRGERYHLRILTVNEGADYHVEAFDAALRDRAVLQIPMDVFPQSEKDVRAMVDAVLDDSSTPAAPGDEDHRAAVFEAFVAARAMPLDASVTPYLAYLSGLGNCVRSPTGFKEGIALAPARDCVGCHFAATFDNQNLCGHVRGPSPRALVNLLRVAQACALLRNCVGLGPSSVTLADLEAMAPFVLRGKIGLDPSWVDNSGPRSGPEQLGFAGCEWVAVLAVVKYTRSQFERFAESDAFWISERLSLGFPVDEAARAHLLDYIDSSSGGAGDNWCFNRVRLSSL